MSYSNKETYLDGNLRVCENELEVWHRNENGVDTLKRPHDTLSKP